MDRLEDFIRENRGELDRYLPGKKVWKNIRTRSPKRSGFRWMQAAAVLVLTMALAFFLYRHKMISKNEKLNLEETEIYYNNIFNSLYREASPVLTGYPDAKKELSAELGHLDSLCADIRRDLKDNVSNQEVIMALIQNYREKIRILEEMLTALKDEDHNGEKSKSNGI